MRKMRDVGKISDLVKVPKYKQLKSLKKIQERMSTVVQNRENQIIGILDAVIKIPPESPKTGCRHKQFCMES